MYLVQLLGSFIGVTALLKYHLKDSIALKENSKEAWHLPQVSFDTLYNQGQVELRKKKLWMYNSILWHLQWMMPIISSVRKENKNMAPSRYSDQIISTKMAIFELF